MAPMMNSYFNAPPMFAFTLGDGNSGSGSKNSGSSSKGSDSKKDDSKSSSSGDTKLAADKDKVADNNSVPNKIYIS